jgi:hypothetical protein
MVSILEYRPCHIQYHLDINVQLRRVTHLSRKRKKACTHHFLLSPWQDFQHTRSLHTFLPLWKFRVGGLQEGSHKFLPASNYHFWRLGVWSPCLRLGLGGNLLFFEAQGQKDQRQVRLPPKENIDWAGTCSMLWRLLQTWLQALTVQDADFWALCRLTFLDWTPIFEWYMHSIWQGF